MTREHPHRALQLSERNAREEPGRMARKKRPSSAPTAARPNSTSAPAARGVSPEGGGQAQEVTTLQYKLLCLGTAAGLLKYMLELLRLLPDRLEVPTWAVLFGLVLLTLGVWTLLERRQKRRRSRRSAGAG